MTTRDMKPAPCMSACGAGEDVRGWLRLGARAAWEAVVAANPLPACMGRICYAPCEDACVLDRSGRTLRIRSLEGALGELAIESGWPLPAPAPATGLRITVVGSGPCGLSAAYHLALAGHNVRLMEAHTQLGGMMRRGISPQAGFPAVSLTLRPPASCHWGSMCAPGPLCCASRTSSTRRTASCGQPVRRGASPLSGGARSGANPSTPTPGKGARQRCPSVAGAAPPWP